VPVASLITSIRGFAAAGTSCFDLDLSLSKEPESRDLLLAHPSLLDGTERPVSLTSLLKEDFSDGLSAVSFTLEPKDDLQSPSGLSRLADEIGRVGGHAPIDLIVGASTLLLGAPALPPAVGIAVPLRDKRGCDMDDIERLGGGAGLPASVRILMPSMACLRQRSVQRLVKSWRQAVTTRGLSLLSAGAEVHAWIVDDCETLREAQALGVERVISNVPALLRECP
jgi:hypothetical protein